MRLVTWLECLAIKAYRAARHNHLSPCRFVPSCSSYALEALERHRFSKGNRLIIARLLRCNPWGPYGADPVPPAVGPKGRRRLHTSHPKDHSWTSRPS